MTGYKVFAMNAPFAAQEVVLWHPKGETKYIPASSYHKALQELADANAEIRYLKAELKLAKVQNSSKHK